MKLSLVGGALAGLLVTLGAVATPAAAQQAAAGATKIAYVNSRQVLRETPGYTAAESTFTKELEGFRREVATIQSSFDSAATAFEQSSVMLSPTQRQAKQKELQAKQQTAEQRTQELQQRAAQRERELLDPIQQRVNNAIEAVRRDGNYAVVFDASAPGSAIVAADKALDLTQRVIQRLKSGS